MGDWGMTLVLMFAASVEDGPHRTRKHVFTNVSLATRDADDDAQR